MKSNIEIITENLKLREVMEFYGVKFNRRGYALCPFHSEKTASLSIRDEKYKCFGCGEYGGIIDFVMKYFNLTFRQAIARLGADFNLPLSFRKPTYRERLKMAELRRKRDEERRVKETEERNIREHYDAWCAVHRICYGVYVRTGDPFYRVLCEDLSKVLNDFSGREARAWTEDLEARMMAVRLKSAIEFIQKTTL